jgi:flagellar basal-body rod protein FlgB
METNGELIEMAINLDTLFGIHEKALEVRTQRAQIIANNLANADTPGYKARDIDFKQVLASVDEPDSLAGNLALRATAGQQHSQSLSPDTMNGLLYRETVEPSVDGNTVDTNIEKAQFAQNSIQFQASFNFLNDRIKGILSAIRGD